MPKIKTKRVGFKLDMTPMVDVAFLLLTFFMLTTQFRPPEPTPIDLPSSNATVPLPDTDILMVQIGKSDELFLGVDSQPARERIFESTIRKQLQEAGYPAIEDSLRKFKLADAFAINKENLEKMIIAARFANPKVRPVIKADVNSSYEMVDFVMKTFKRTNMPTFNLITGLEGGLGDSNK
ncbi:MAG: ExbD/TolR family protein [Chloroherpetonaceae bacterium]